MKKFYISAFLLITLAFANRSNAQMLCHASFYVDSMASTPFNAVLVNNSVSYLTPPDSALFTWSWGDGTSSTGRYPSHTYSSFGVKTIKLMMSTVNKTCGDTLTKTITIDSMGGVHKTNAAFNITVVAPKSTGIAAIQNEGMVSITPNIVKEDAILNFKGLEKNAPVEVEVFNSNGKSIVAINQSLNGNTLQLTTSTLPAGMYFVVVKMENKSSVVKFIKQ